MLSRVLLSASREHLRQNPLELQPQRSPPHLQPLEARLRLYIFRGHYFSRTLKLLLSKLFNDAHQAEDFEDFNWL